MKNEASAFDFADFLAITGLSFIVLLIVLSALMTWKNKLNLLKNFKRTKKLLEAFDVKDNVKKLLNLETDMEADAGLQVLKAFVMFMLVFRQTYQLMTTIPDNPIYIEKVDTICNKFKVYNSFVQAPQKLLVPTFRC